MKTSVTRLATFRCSLERAFKAPMLCDIRKVHTGFLLMPRVTHCEDEAGWGQPGSSKRVFMSKTLAFGGGEASIDRVIERVENVKWTIEVGEFRMWMLGFERFVGEWETTARGGEVDIVYRYTLHGTPWLAPFQWVFAQTFWRVYMGRVLENVRRMAEGDEPILFP